MITVKQHEKLIDKIKRLSELELDGLLRDVAEHLRKNDLEHLIDASFQMDDQTGTIEELEDEIESLEEKLEETESKLQHTEVELDTLLSKLEDLISEDCGVDYMQEQITNLITESK